MPGRRPFLQGAALAAAFLLAAPVAAQPASEAPLAVVASFSILGDMVERVGGDRVDVATLVGPGGDAHVYQPTPADARALGAADLLVVNGLGFEGWIDRLVGAVGFDGATVVAIDGIEPLPAAEDEGHEEDHDHGAFDPHAWQSLANARVYAANIAEALASADPEGAAAFEANLAGYVGEIDALEAEIRGLVAAIPPERRTVVTSHDAFGYFGAAYGLRFLAPQGLSTEAEASAADVAALIRQIREERVPAVFVETIADRRLLERIAEETGAAIGGALYSDALSGPDGPAPSYLAMMHHNARTIAAAVGGS